MHLQVLKLAKSLIQARILMSGSVPTVYETPVHTSIRRLYLSPTPVLDFLTAPDLEEITLWVPPDNGPDLRAHLGPFLARSSCPLRRLCLHRKPDSQIMGILAEFSCIVELVIIITGSEAAQGVNALVSALTVSTPGPTASMALLPHPHLRSMYFGCGMESWINYAKMLTSRWKVPNSGDKP
ncbi:hypothetical protein DFH07DRAFT_960371 [Mycena maculata]|uniref:Uncharacterized protein n=1 Tax=Mycena maculata TaxID=230809 RepID=A0AAD7IZT3_9AGAR|nr:hypothetical protein DFH07DRAFT_960371 [Mycena maculata]